MFALALYKCFKHNHSYCSLRDEDMGLTGAKLAFEKLHFRKFGQILKIISVGLEISQRSDKWICVSPGSGVNILLYYHLRFGNAVRYYNRLGVLLFD